MAITSLSEYPEIIAAMVLALLLVFRTAQAQLPAWLTQPALSCFLLAPQSYVGWAERSLVQAGYRSSGSLSLFACTKVYLPCLSLLLYFVLPPANFWALEILLLAAPDLFLLSRVRARQEEIRTSLPQALDLMVMCVDAGLSLDAALDRLAGDDSSLASALHDELRIVAREVLLGRDREDVYDELFERTGVSELKTLASALNQANKLGLSIGQILRAQSEFVRRKLAQKAEEKALKIPVYMAFPLWLFIMPALLLVVLGPSLLNFFHQVHRAL